MLDLRLLSIAAALFSCLASCGGEAAIATADELAASLVGVESLQGTWTVNVPPDGGGIPESGIVPEEMQDMLPQLGLCDAAGPDAQSAAEELTWKAFRQLDLTVEDPIEPPGDRSGHMVFVQESLTSGEPDAIKATFDALRSGFEACLGDIPPGEEGPGTAEAFPVPGVGDDRFGVLTVIGESGGYGEWRIHTAVVRRGSALMSMNVVDIRMGEAVDPYFTSEQVEDMIVTAANAL